jgi:hypothetical protein
MHFDKLVAHFCEKLLVQNEKIRAGICPSPADAAYAVDFSADSGAKVHLRAGPARRDELERLMEPAREDNFRLPERSLPGAQLYKDCPETSLFLDIDYYREELMMKELIPTYESALKFHATLSQNMVNYLFGVGE